MQNICKENAIKSGGNFGFCDFININNILRGVFYFALKSEYQAVSSPLTARAVLTFESKNLLHIFHLLDYDWVRGGENMLLKNYLDKRISMERYYILIDTLRNLYQNELDDRLVYYQDIPSQTYVNGRLLLIFDETSLIKVNFTGDTININSVKYKEVKGSFFRKDHPDDYQPGTLTLTFSNEEIILNPMKDFTFEVNEKVDLIKKIYKYLSTK